MVSKTINNALQWAGMVTRPDGFENRFRNLIAVCRKNLPSCDEDLIKRAFLFGLDAHIKDLRESGEPYFYHAIEVAMILAREIPLDDISIASALLHDVVEDTEYDLKHVREEFGDTIADIVDGATKISDIFKSHEITQAENYRKLLLSMVNDIRVIMLKFADRLHNMRTLQYISPERQKRKAKETLDIYAPFAHRFGLGKIKWELEDLSFKYLYPEDYDTLATQLKEKRRERVHYIRKFIAPIEKRLHEDGFTFEIEGRPKHLWSIFNKMRRRGKSLDELYDLFAVRIILDTENNNDCFQVYGIVSEIYIPIPERFKNYISVPKKNGYQSIHTTVVGPEGKMVEVQIRTRNMHEIAEKGVAAHWKYKDRVSVADPEMEQWVNWVRDIFENSTEADVPAQQLLESFKLNLYQNEIYVFTPKGDLRILPKGSTPVDFAFDIHTKVGLHCIGAKVNGRIVPLSTVLQSGDQIEIITSKNQTPNADWEQFAVTHKAKSHVRRWRKEEERKQIEQGKELWQKKLKKIKLHINEDELLKQVLAMRYNNLQEFYYDLAQKPDLVDEHAEWIVDRVRRPKSPETEQQERQESDETVFQRFVKSARDRLGGISVYGKEDSYLHTYAKCCNPIPGDAIIGYVTTGTGIKIHRKNCKNIAQLYLRNEDRIVDVDWPVTNGQSFVVGLKINGDDRPGLLNDITQTVFNHRQTNIRSVNFDTKEGLFDGLVIMEVRDLDHLNSLIEKVKKVRSVKSVKRFEE
jgi:GTP diphosphokinase / guanosine-3',5'-bis(diphosphate) 3'-diphosphatase